MAQKITKDIEEKVRGFVDLLKPEITVASAYVFGSHAKGVAHGESDVDVAIISPDFGDDRMENSVYLQRKLWHAPFQNMDVVGYSPEYFENENSPLVSEIKKHGVLVL